MDEKKRLISDAIFMISVKHTTSNQSTNIPLYIIEDDSGHEADVASHFIRQHGLNNGILNELTNVIKQQLATYFKRKDNALFFIDFTTPHGTRSIFVTKDDDIEQVASDFVERQELPKSAIKKLQAIIKEKRDLILKQQQDAQQPIHTDNNNDNDINEKTSTGQEKTSTAQEKTSTGQEKQHDITKKHKVVKIEKPVKEEAGHHDHGSALTIDTSSKVGHHQSTHSRKPVVTPSFVSSFRDTDNSAATSHSTTNQDETEAVGKNDNIFERLHNNAMSLRRSQEQLKRKIEKERKSNIDSTSFKNSIGHTRNSPSRRVRSHSVDSLSRRGRMVVDDDGILNRRPLSVCRAIRAEHPSPAVQNQEAFDRLYGVAHHQEVTKRALKIHTELERRKTIDETTFKSSVGHLPSSPSNRTYKYTTSVFDRLNKDAEHKESYLGRLKEITDEERRRSVQSTTFKESIGFVSYSPSLKVQHVNMVDGSFHENLYQRDLQWLKRRNKSLADLGSGIKKKKDEDELREIKDKPELFTSPSKQRPSSVSKDELFANLYEYADVQREQQSRLWISYELQRTKDMNSPMLVAPKSHEMARKVQAERIEKKLNSSIYREDYSSPYINNDNLVVADFTSPFVLDKLGEDRLEAMAGAVEATQDNRFVNPENNSPAGTKEGDQVSNITSASSKTGSSSRKNKKGAFSLKTSTILSPNIVDDDNIIFGTFGESPVLANGGSSQQQTPKTGILDTVGSDRHHHHHFRKSLDSNKSNKSNASTLSIFDQLYEERHTCAEKLQNSIQKHKPSFNFSPVLETNNHINNKIEDKKRRELTKDAFYQRMYNYRLEHDKIINDNAEKMKEQESSKDISYGVKLDEDDQKRMIGRLTSYYPERHNMEIDRMKEKTRPHFETVKAIKKSDEIAKKARRNSLSKIFDSLLISVEIVMESKMGTSSLSETKEESSQQLNVKMAIPEALECPPNLHDAVRKVLSNATSDFLSKDQFIHKMESLMKCGVNAPISASLSVPYRPKVVESSEDIVAKCCKEKPDLVATKTYILASQKRPLPGQAIEDHLQSYDDLYERNKSKLREDLEVEESKACTFQPIFYSKYTYSPHKDTTNKTQT